MTQRELTFPSNAVPDRPTEVKGFLAQPEHGAKRGSILVVHEVFGLTDHIRDVARRLAEAGFTALAPDLLTREGEPPELRDGNFQPLREFIAAIPDRQILGDLKAAAATLRGLPESNQKVGLVGFCWGGRVSMLSAAELPELDACVAYYGRITGDKTENQPAYPLDLADRMNVPLLGHFGAEDQSIPVSDAEKLRDALQQHGKTAEFYIYENAGHAFNNDARPSYRAEAATLAWTRTLAWFEKYLD
jgi:carboxymethylenebutenolidase